MDMSTDGKLSDMTPVEWVIVVSACLVALALIAAMPFLLMMLIGFLGYKKYKKQVAASDTGVNVDNTSMDLSQNPGIQLQNMSS